MVQYTGTEPRMVNGSLTLTADPADVADTGDATCGSPLEEIDITDCFAIGLEDAKSTTLSFDGPGVSYFNVDFDLATSADCSAEDLEALDDGWTTCPVGFHANWRIWGANQEVPAYEFPCSSALDGTACNKDGCSFAGSGTDSEVDNNAVCCKPPVDVDEIKAMMEKEAISVDDAAKLLEIPAKYAALHSAAKCKTGWGGLFNIQTYLMKRSDGGCVDPYTAVAATDALKGNTLFNRKWAFASDEDYWGPMGEEKRLSIRIEYTGETPFAGILAVGLKRDIYGFPPSTLAGQAKVDTGILTKFGDDPMEVIEIKKTAQCTDTCRPVGLPIPENAGEKACDVCFQEAFCSGKCGGSSDVTTTMAPGDVTTTMAPGSNSTGNSTRRLQEDQCAKCTQQVQFGCCSGATATCPEPGDGTGDGNGTGNGKNANGAAQIGLGVVASAVVLLFA